MLEVGVVGGVLSELAETKNNLSARNAKSKGGRAENSTLFR